jgi:hypothetical protein
MKHSLKLPENNKEIFDSEISLLKLKDNTKSACITAGSIICFMEGLSAQQKSDVLNSTLLAQLSANKKFDREANTVGWYNEYITILRRHGWNIQAFNFIKHESSQIYELSFVVLNTLADTMGNKLIPTIRAAIDATKSLKKDSKAFTIWKETTHSSNGGNFTVLPCSNVDNAITMFMGCFYFSAKNVDTDFLWHLWNPQNIEFYKSAQIGVLNENVYAPLRDSVIEKLSTDATNFIADIDV